MSGQESGVKQQLGHDGTLQLSNESQTGSTPFYALAALEGRGKVYRLMPLKRFNNIIPTSTSVWWWEICDSPTCDPTVGPPEAWIKTTDLQDNYYMYTPPAFAQLNISTYNIHTHPCLSEYLKWLWFPLFSDASPIFSRLSTNASGDCSDTPTKGSSGFSLLSVSTVHSW